MVYRSLFIGIGNKYNKASYWCEQWRWRLRVKCKRVSQPCGFVTPQQFVAFTSSVDFPSLCSRLVLEYLWQWFFFITELHKTALHFYLLLCIFFSRFFFFFAPLSSCLSLFILFKKLLSFILHSCFISFFFLCPCLSAWKCYILSVFFLLHVYFFFSVTHNVWLREEKNESLQWSRNRSSSSIGACMCTVCVNGSLRAAPQSAQSLCSSIMSAVLPEIVRADIRKDTQSEIWWLRASVGTL